MVFIVLSETRIDTYLSMLLGWPLRRLATYLNCRDFLFQGRLANSVTTSLRDEVDSSKENSFRYFFRFGSNFSNLMTILTIDQLVDYGKLYILRAAVGRKFNALNLSNPSFTYYRYYIIDFLHCPSTQNDF